MKDRSKLITSTMHSLDKLVIGMKAQSSLIKDPRNTTILKKNGRIQEDYFSTLLTTLKDLGRNYENEINLKK